MSPFSLLPFLPSQGVSVMNLFGKARINVNLLIHFINVKFYGRK